MPGWLAVEGREPRPAWSKQTARKSRGSRAMPQARANNKKGLPPQREALENAVAEDQSSARRLLLYFLSSSSPMFLGTGAYFSNSMVNSALPWVSERRSVA